MGNASDRQRITWRVGSARDGNDVTFTQNDVGVMMSNLGMSFVDSGIGHTFATATAIPTTVDGMVDVNDPLHRGVISPIMGANGFNPIGAGNYTSDFFSFVSNGVNAINLTLHDGNDLITAGVADNGATLRGVLSIFDANFVLVGMGTEDVSTLFSVFSSVLNAGTYYARVSSFGGHNEVTATFDAAQYYDMGGYFLTGSGFVAVPEPSMLGAFAIAFVTISLKRRRSSI